MKIIMKLCICLLFVSIALANCGTPETDKTESEDIQIQEIDIDIDKGKENSFLDKPLWVNSSITINATKSKVWEVFQSPAYSKILGEILDSDVFIESDWKLNSKVHYKVEPNTILTTGTISKLIENELIEVDFDFKTYVYQEKYKLTGDSNTCTFEIHIGPYKVEFEEQKVIWQNWLNKVKEISEQE